MKMEMEMEFDHNLEHVDTHMIIVQANIDDMNPEFSSHISDLLFAVGVNDVYWIPIIMKKGRPGMILNVLTGDDLLPEVERIIFEETTTLGIRYWPATVHRLGRKSVPVHTSWGTVHVKAGFYQGKLVQFAPEFKECESIARSHGVPLKKVYDEVRNLFMKGLDNQLDNQ